MPTILELIASHAAYERAEFDTAGTATRLEAQLTGHDRRAICLVAELDGAVVGYSTASREFSTWRAREYLHMDTLFVDGRHRRKHVGQALMYEVRQHAQRQALDHVEWQTPDWNDDAVRFYERLGATPAKKQRFSWAVPPDPSRSNRATLDAFTNAWTDRDVPALASCLHPECRYSPSFGPTALAPAFGRDAVLDAIAAAWRHDATSVAEFGPTVETVATITRTWTYSFPDGHAEHGIDVFSFDDTLISGKDAYRKLPGTLEAA